MRTKNSAPYVRYIVTAMLVFVLHACADENDMKSEVSSAPSTEGSTWGELVWGKDSWD